MARYVFLFKAESAGAGQILFGASEAAERQVDAIEQLGGSVEVQHFVTGAHDLVLIADLPSEAASLAVSLAAEAGGFQVDTMRAFDAAELDQAQSLVPEVRDWLRGKVASAVDEEPGKA